MLVCLSEINCLKNLSNIGVYPDYFYTDFEKFKEENFLFQDAIILIIFAGSFHFRKRLVLDEAFSLMDRANDSADLGIKRVYILSDITLPRVEDYYMFQHDFTEVYHSEGWKHGKVKIEFWEKLQNTPRQTSVVLSPYDLGDYSAALEAWNNRSSTEDKYLEDDLIKKPDLSAYRK